MIWASLAIFAAFGQALGWALKKKSLAIQGLNTTLGLISYIIAGLVFTIFFFVLSPDRYQITITTRFVIASFFAISLNVVAAVAAYRVIDKESFSRIMALIPATVLFIVPIEYVLNGFLPTAQQIFGMIFIILGSIGILRKNDSQKSITRQSVWYFTIVLVCYSVSSPLMKVMVEETSNPLFSGMILHLGIGFGFIPLVLLSREYKTLQRKNLGDALFPTLGTMITAGLVIALIENGPIYFALERAQASEVFALKRLMPFFGLILGILMFKEKITAKQVFATVLTVLGAVLVILYKSY